MPYALPYEVYEIDANNVLIGFTEEFLANPSAYDMCDTMQIPSRVISVADKAFITKKNTTSIPPFITKLTFAEGSKCSSIGGSAFKGAKLISLIFPNSLKEIDSFAFIECSLLNYVDFSNATNLSSIGDYVFESCYALRSINFPRNLNSIGGLAFSGCSSLTFVSFPSNLSTIGEDVFYDCSKLDTIEWNSWNGNVSLDYTSFSGVCPDGGVINIKNPVNGHDSVELLQHLKSNGELPQTWGAALPESVYNIGDDNGVLYGFTEEFLANPSPYSGCNYMLIPANVTSIADKAFYANRSSTIPSFITNLTFVEGSVCSTIGVDAFYKSSLTTIKFNNTLQTIGLDAFADCSKLASVDFPSSLQSIGEWAFTKDYALTSISFPEDNNGKYGLATNLGDNAQVVVEKDSDGNYKWTNSSKEVGSLVHGDVIIPEGITSIGVNAFIGCHSLTSITLPSSLQSIGRNGFQECDSLTSITFPSSLQSIGEWAFIICSSLNEIVWNNLSTAPTIGWMSFHEIANTGHVKSTGSYTSSQLLSLLQEKGSLPSAWEVA